MGPSIEPAGASILAMDSRWRAVLRGETPAALATRLGRRMFATVPGRVRCKVCNAPFDGPLAPIFRLWGYRPSRKTPRFCARCVEWAPDGGAVVPVSVLFGDVRGYSALAEHQSTVEVAALLQRYYAAASSALLRHDAILGQIAGDEVMALFVPGLTGVDYARKAVAGGQALLAGVGYGTPAGPWIEVGVGICTGEEYVGNVGGGGFKDFTAVGAVTNTAARLQAVAGGGEIVVDAATYLAVSQSYPSLEREVLDLPGKLQPTEAYRIGQQPSAAITVGVPR
jgi:adenylate cyclase